MTERDKAAVLAEILGGVRAAIAVRPTRQDRFAVQRLRRTLETWGSPDGGRKALA